MNASFLINDGQHRKTAIVSAIQEDDSLSKETISIVFFGNEGLERSQQMFTDLNKHAVKTSNSLSTLYDTRDALSVLTKKLVKSVTVLKKYTDLEHDNLGKNSLHFFTLNSLKKANSRIFNSKELNDKDELFLNKYWNCVFANIDEWQNVLDKKMTKREMRENYILPLSVTINAFGKLGEYFYHNQKRMDIVLKKLKAIDWSRNASENWQNRLIGLNGKIINNEESITLTCSRIKLLLGIELSREEQMKEKGIRIHNVNN